MKIAIVQDGTELARQPHADAEEVFRSIAARPFLESKSAECEFYRDGEVGHLLEGVTPDVYPCLVLASNALFDRTGPIWRAVERCTPDLVQYLAGGGSVVALHQGRGYQPLRSLFDQVRVTAVLDVDAEAAQRQTDRRLVDKEVSDEVVAVLPDDPLLWYPRRIDVERLASTMRISERRLQLYFRVIDMAELPAMDAVLSMPSGVGASRIKQDVVLARGELAGGGRIVLSTIPLDWGLPDLLENAVGYAISGAPRMVVWTIGDADTGGLEQQLLDRQLTLRTDVAVRPWPFESSGELAPEDAWLLRQVDIALTPTVELFERVAQRREGRAFIEAGKTVVVPEPSPQRGATLIRAQVGSRLARQIAEHLLLAFRAAGPRWVSGLFEDRNVVCALTYCRDLYGDALIGQAENQEFDEAVERARASLEDHDTHARDLGSALAVAEILVRARYEPKELKKTCEGLMSLEKPLDSSQAQQLEAMQAVITRFVGADGTRPQEWLTKVVAEWGEQLAEDGPSQSLGSLVRGLRSIRFVIETCAATLTDAEAETLTEGVLRQLEQEPFTEGAGWTSLEATAEIAMGLVVLKRAQTSGGAGDSALIAANNALTRAWRRQLEAGDRIGVVAIVSEALLSVEQVMPSGNERLIAALGTRDPAMSRAESPTGQPQLGSSAAAKQLITVNRQLLDQQRDIDEDVRSSAVAATIGRIAVISLCSFVLLIGIGLGVLSAISGLNGEWDVVGALAPSSAIAFSAAIGLERFAAHHGVSLLRVERPGHTGTDS